MKKLTLLLVFVLTSLLLQAQQTWETIPLNSYKWQISKELSVLSNTTTNLRVENLNAASKYSKKNKLIDYLTATLNLNMKENKPFEISFRIVNQNNNPYSFKYRVYEKDKDGNRKKKWFQGAIHWGISVEFYGMNGKQVSNEVWFNVYRGSYGNSYQINKNNSGWRNQGYSTEHTIYIKKGDDNSIKFYIDYESNDNLIGGWTNIAGIKQITIMAGTASKVEVSDFKMQRKTTYSIAKPIVDKGDEYFKKEMYSHAINEYTEAINQGYKNADIYMKRAKAYAYIENYGKAIDDCTFALTFDYSNKEAYFIRGLCKFEKDDKSCVADFKKADDKSVANFFYNRALEYSKQNNYLQSITYNKMALEIDQNHYWANNSIGYDYYLIEEYESAVPYLLRAIELQKNNPFAYSNLGGCYVGLEQYSKAISYCQTAISVKDKYNLNPDNGNLFYYGEPYYYMGLAYGYLNDWNKALEFLIIAAELENEDAQDLLEVMLKDIENENNNTHQQKHPIQQQSRPPQNTLKKDPNFKIE